MWRLYNTQGDYKNITADVTYLQEYTSCGVYLTKQTMETTVKLDIT